jgi:hypothetical protein
VSGDGRDTGSDADTYRFEPAQFIHHSMHLLGVRSLGIENRLGVVEDYEHLPGRKGGPQWYQVLGIFNPRTDDFGESGEEMRKRSWDLIAVDESPVITKPFLDAIVVEERESDRSFPDSPSTDESYRFEIFGESNDLLN